MTVRADHLALLDLFKDALPASLREAPAYLEQLVTQMIELKHDWIVLTAVHARMRREVLD